MRSGLGAVRSHQSEDASREHAKSGWRVARLADVADFRLGKMLDGRKNKGYLRPYLANVNVRWGRFNLDDLRQMRFEEHEIEKYGLRDGDIVMCEGGEPGRCALWKEQMPGMTLQKALHRIRPDACMSNQFLYYNLFYRGRTGRFAPLFTGATIKHLPRQQLAKVEVDAPPLAEQERIADILSAYDDLIENNRRRTALLEEAPRELYREWFVRLRFPRNEYTVIVDGLPEGWERKTLGAVANITMGQSPKSTHYNETGAGLPFHQGVADFGDRFPAHRMYCSLEDRVAAPGDILFSVRAPVGRINLTLDKIVIGRGVAAVRSVEDRQSFLFYSLKNHFFREDMIGGGTIFSAVTKKELHGVRIVQPDHSVVQMFMDRIRSVDSQIEGLHRTTEQLMRARDLLLPRLMSGEVVA